MMKLSLDVTDCAGRIYACGALLTLTFTLLDNIRGDWSVRSVTTTALLWPYNLVQYAMTRQGPPQPNKDE